MHTLAHRNSKDRAELSYFEPPEAVCTYLRIRRSGLSSWARQLKERSERRTSKADGENGACKNAKKTFSENTLRDWAP